jgi:hypothetical protein
MPAMFRRSSANSARLRILVASSVIAWDADETIRLRAIPAAIVSS